MRYLAIDTETTGLPKCNKYRAPDFSNVWPIQVAAVLYEDGDEIDGLSRLVKYDPMPEITKESRAIHQIEDREVIDYGVDVMQAADELCEIVSEADIVIGQNVYEFDVPVIDRVMGPIDWPEIHDTKLMWQAYSAGMPRMDGEALDYYYGRLAGGAWRNCGQSSLAFLCNLFQVENAKEHDALSDADACAGVFRAMGHIFELMGVHFE